MTDTNETKPAVQWPIRIALTAPIEWSGQRITGLEVRRGKLGDIKGIKLTREMPTEDLIKIASRLTGQPTQVIELLDADDAGEVMEIAADFYGRCLGGRTR